MTASNRKAATIRREQRRKNVAKYIMQSMPESEIAARLNVSRSVISKDVAALCRIASDFVYSLAKDRLSVFYKDTLDNLLAARSAAWDIYNSSKDEQKRLNALKVIVTSNTEMFNLLQAGPAVLSVRSLEAGLRELQQSQQQNNGVSA